MRLKGPIIKRRPVSPEDLGTRLNELSRPVVLVALVLLLGIFGWWGYKSLQARREEAAQVLLTNSLQILQNVPDRPSTEETATGPQEALPLLNQIREEYPSSNAAEQALLQIGHILYAVRKYEDALVAYQRYLEQYPKGSSVVLAGLGRAYAMESQGQFKVAASIFQSLADRYRHQPLSVDALLGAARALQQAQETQDALSIYRRIVQDYPGTSWSRRAEVRLAYLER